VGQRYVHSILLSFSGGANVTQSKLVTGSGDDDPAGVVSFAQATEGAAGKVCLPLVTASGQTDIAQAEVAGEEDLSLVLIGSFGGLQPGAAAIAAW
jgi:hypothetical protein